MVIAETPPLRPCVLIPCLNCASTIGDVVHRSRELVSSVLVVDDGSTDGSAEVARGAGAEVILHETNLGKGAALRSGLIAAGTRGFTHAVTLDADRQHDPHDLPPLLEEAKRHPWSIVVGARRFDGPNIPKASRFGRRFSNFWVWLETGRRLDDTQSGFRVYPVEPTLALSVRPSRFEWEVEVLVRASWAGLDVREIPIDVYYPPLDERVSHYRGFADSVLISLLHFRLVPRSLLRGVWRPRLLDSRLRS